MPGPTQRGSIQHAVAHPDDRVRSILDTLGMTFVGAEWKQIAYPDEHGGWEQYITPDRRLTISYHQNNNYTALAERKTSESLKSPVIRFVDIQHTILLKYKGFTWSKISPSKWCLNDGKYVYLWDGLSYREDALEREVAFVGKVGPVKSPRLTERELIDIAYRRMVDERREYALNFHKSDTFHAPEVRFTRVQWCAYWPWKREIWQRNDGKMNPMLQVEFQGDGWYSTQNIDARSGQNILED